MSIQFLFSVSTINKVWVFCCESMGELKAWQNNLEEARLSAFAKPGYPNASPLLLNQTLVRNPLIPTPFHPGQFNPTVLSQLPSYLPTTQTLPGHAPATGLPPPTFSSPLIAQHPLSFPMVPLLNSPYAHPSMQPHPANNGLLLSGAMPVGNHQLTGAQLSAAHHPTSLASHSPYPAPAHHHSLTTNALHHPPANSHHPQANHYPAATLSNGVSSMGASQAPSYSTRQPILPTTAMQATAVPNMYNRADLGLLPHHHQGHPLLWTPNSVWW